MGSTAEDMARRESKGRESTASGLKEPSEADLEENAKSDVDDDVSLEEEEEERDLSPPPFLEEGVYIVERILNKKTYWSRTKEVIEYQVKWKGYAEAENTWEKRENLGGCTEMLRLFEKELQEKRRQRRFEGSQDSDEEDTSDDDEGPKTTQDLFEDLAKKAAEEAAKQEAEGRPGRSLRERQEREPAAEALKKKVRKEVNQGETTAPLDAMLEPRGFARGLEAEFIIGATEFKGHLMFLVKWKGVNEADLVLAQEANQKCPDVIITFYQKKMAWPV